MPAATLAACRPPPAAPGGDTVRRAAASWWDLPATAARTAALRASRRGSAGDRRAPLPTRPPGARARAAEQNRGDGDHQRDDQHHHEEPHDTDSTRWPPTAPPRPRARRAAPGRTAPGTTPG